MSTLVVGDVHGCAEELDVLLKKVQAQRVVFVGDLFTKGPDPAGVFSLVRDHETVLGNHEERLIRALQGGGISRSVSMTMALLDVDPWWRTWIQSLPLFLEVGGFTVVHAGLHPTGELELTTREMALVMRRFPMTDPAALFWWKQYTGDRRVIFGHDAIRGLVRVERAGKPQLIGLDTGCVYGGSLSGYVIESDEVVQVPAAHVYRRP